MSLRRLVVAGSWVALAVLAGACGVREQNAPVAASPTRQANALARPDTTQPVASGNTPAAADVAAAAGLRAGFDPARDPAKDLETARVEAARRGKRILLEVGDARCGQCAALDTLLEGDAPLRRQRDAGYIWVKVNQDAHNPNAGFLAQYPPARARPHLYVLDASGALLHSQPVQTKDDPAQGIDRQAVLQLLEQWAPGPTEPAS